MRPAMTGTPSKRPWSYGPWKSFMGDVAGMIYDATGARIGFFNRAEDAEYVVSLSARIAALEAQLAERAGGVNEDALRALAQAYDREDAAQRGEPDPWNLDDPGDIGDSDTWVSERLACARAAAEAFLSALSRTGAVKERDKPTIHAVFECSENGINGSTNAPVKRVVIEDDGSFTVVIDHWPASKGQQEPVVWVIELSENTGELIDKMAEAIRGDTTSDDTPWATLSDDRKEGWRGDAERALAVVKEYLTARRAALSAPHGDDLAAQVAVHCAGSQPASDTPDPRDELIRELREALKPFAASGIDVSGTAAVGVTEADIRRARAALSKGEGAK